MTPMTPAVPAAAGVTFPHTITVVQRDTVTLEELSRVLKLSPNRLKRLHRCEGFPLLWAGQNGPVYSLWSLVDSWMAKRPVPETVKPVK